MSLGQNIYNLRTGREMSQLELAEALGVSRQSISKWETDASVPELEKLIKLSELFGGPLSALCSLAAVFEEVVLILHRADTGCHGHCVNIVGVC